MPVLDHIRNRATNSKMRHLPILVELCPQCHKAPAWFLMCKMCGSMVKTQRNTALDQCFQCWRESSKAEYMPTPAQIAAEAELIRAERPSNSIRVDSDSYGEVYMPRVIHDPMMHRRRGVK